MATNLQTGSGWRFAKDYAADHRVGRIDRPDLPLSRVVAASSAFPPFLSPVRLLFSPGTVKPMAGADLHQAPFTEVAMLTDGGVYDNLGLERVWRRCRTVKMRPGDATTMSFITRSHSCASMKLCGERSRYAQLISCQPPIPYSLFRK
jgi:hypothetical protein